MRQNESRAQTLHKVNDVLNAVLCWRMLLGLPGPLWIPGFRN